MGLVPCQMDRRDGKTFASRHDEDGVGSTGEVPDGLAPPRRYWAMLAMFLSLSMAVIDSSITNIALPTIARDVQTSAANSIWVVNAYQLGMVVTLLPMAALAELVGYRRVYTLGLSVFVLASVACAMSDSLTSLAAGRLVQGFGAASIFGINAAVVRFIYPRALLGRGMGYNATVVAVASACGPTIAAGVLAVASWRWLFLANLPFGLLALMIGIRALPYVEPEKGRFDTGSAVLNAIASAMSFLAISNLSRAGRPAWTLVMAGMAACAGVALVRRSRSQERPLLPLDLLRIGVLRLSYATSGCSFAAQTALMVALPFYLQERFGFDPVHTGLVITPMPVGIALASLAMRGLIDRASAGLLGGLGLGLFAASSVAIALIPVGTGIAPLVVATGVAGFGFGLFQTPNNRAMLSLAPTHRTGAAAGMLAVARLLGQIGGALAIAMTFRLEGPASSLSIWMVGVLAVAGALFSLRRLSS